MKNLPVKRLGTVRRQAVSLSSAQMIRAELLYPDRTLPLLVQPNRDTLNLVAWAHSQRDWIERHLTRHGGILFRNCQINGAEELEQFMQAVGGKLLSYTYRSTPRTQVNGKIYTSTEYPPSQTIPLHNEMAYSRQWALKIAFFCTQPAREGGETPIADSRRVYQSIPPEIRDRFAQKQVLYVRNYGENLDLPWQDVFQTTDKAEVEAYCRRTGIAWEWQSGDRLQTRSRAQAIATHPRTAEVVWFNQAHLFHISNLNPSVRSALLAQFGEEELPRHAYYGDGSPIEAEALAAIRAAYDRETVKFPWQQGDVLLLDNMLAAHGRMPFVGSRQVLVGMAQSFGCT
jgi:alpha-ketoglutarate-dependent taurine dioxygenase